MGSGCVRHPGGPLTPLVLWGFPHLFLIRIPSHIHCILCVLPCSIWMICCFLDKTGLPSSTSHSHPGHTDHPVLFSLPNLCTEAELLLSLPILSYSIISSPFGRDTLISLSLSARKMRKVNKFHLNHLFLPCVISSVYPSPQHIQKHNTKK